MNKATKESASAELRAAFEYDMRKIYGPEHFEISTDPIEGDGYTSCHMNGAWRGYVAAWNHRTPRAESADYAELRRIAVAATPGPWVTKHGACIQDLNHKMYIYDEGGHSEEDATFIAMFNPAKVLAMIDRLEELEGAKMQLKGDMK